MFKLVYVKNDKEEVIAENITLEEVGKVLVGSFKEKGIDSPYQRYVGIKDDEIMIDYGSHVNFYYLRGENVVKEYFKTF